MGTLYVVATPIGNLGDITRRAVKVLKEVDLIAGEDTRVTAKLLAHLKIKKPIISFHQHSKIQRIDELIGRLRQGQNIALLSDAGTPTISDPGGKLIAEAAQPLGSRIIPIPGPSSVTAALSICGFPADQFLFLGYLPKKKGRQSQLKKIKEQNLTTVIFESPYRIKKTLNELAAILEERKIVVGRELTKKFETIYRGKAAEIKDEVKTRGEFVIVIGP